MQKATMVNLKLLVAPPGYDPLAAQQQLQTKILARFPEGPMTDHQASDMGWLATVAHVNVTAVLVELAELLDHLPSKWWKDYGKLIDEPLRDHVDAVTEAKFELVDSLHFILNIAIALGMDWTELLDIFFTKQTENLARQERGY